MATYEITEADKSLVRQRVLELRGRFDIYTLDNVYLDTLECGLISGNISINAESDIRRTLSITLIPKLKSNIELDKDGIIWLDKKLRFFIGIKNMRTDEYIWYPQGTFVFMSGSSTYDETTNQLQVECSDMMAFLDGSRNGTLGQLKIEYPAYQDYFQTTWVEQAKADGVDVTNKAALFNWVKNQGDDYHNKLVDSTDEAVTNAVFELMTNSSLSWERQDADMEIIKQVYPRAELEIYRTVIDDTGIFVTTIREYNVLRETMMTTVGQFARIKNMEVDEIGEAKGMPGYAKNWDHIKYRQENPQWNKVPYDQEFASGTTMLNIVTTLRDLYENYEAFFDIYETFCCQLIPSGDDDLITFNDDFMQQILISENKSQDFTEPKSIYEVWGQVFEPHFFANGSVSYSGNIYSTSISGFDEGYCNGDLIAIKIPAANESGCYININGYGNVQVYDENYETPIAANMINAGSTSVFKIFKKRNSKTKQDVVKAYFMGEWQPHAIEVLTDGTVGDDYITVTDQLQVKRYSKEYFQAIYNCNVVNMLVIPDSPFTIQQIGEVLAVKTDDNIQSEAIALETAHQELYRAARLTDNITLSTKICPFADVNQKVTYRPALDDETHEYIVKSLSHDISNGTTSWTLMRYKRLYLLPDELIEPSENNYFK